MDLLKRLCGLEFSSFLSKLVIIMLSVIEVLNSHEMETNVVKRDCKTALYSTKELDYLRQIKRGSEVSFKYQSFSEINQRPPWLDEKRLRRGQQFARDFYFGVSLSEFTSLFLLFTDPKNRKPLIYTNNSMTEYTAFKRYLSTVERVKSWYETDLLKHNSLGYKNLNAVFTVHRTVANIVNALSQERINEKSDLKNVIGAKNIMCPMNAILRKDVKSLGNLTRLLSEDGLTFSQVDMTLTQFGFAGTVVLYPERFGIYGRDQEGIKDFVYLWRYIGHMLGIEEEYNLCFSDDMEEIRMRMTAIMENNFKPLMTKIDATWEHMSRVVALGTSHFTTAVTFETSLIYLWETMGVSIDNVYSKLTWSQTFAYYFFNFLYKYAVPYKWIRDILTQSVTSKIVQVSKDFARNERKYKRMMNAL